MYVVTMVILLPYVMCGLHAPAVSEECGEQPYLACSVVPEYHDYEDCVDTIDTHYVEECEDIEHRDCVEGYSHHIHISNYHTLEHTTTLPKCHGSKFRSCGKVPLKEVHTECKKGVATVYVEKCEDDSLLRGCIRVSLPY